MVDDSDSDCGSDLDFANLDLTGVDFDQSDENYSLNSQDSLALEIERQYLEAGCVENLDAFKKLVEVEEAQRLCQIVKSVTNGRFADALKGETSEWFFGKQIVESNKASFRNMIRRMLSQIRTVSECVEAEFLAIAAFNLFLQLNYTGPVVEHKDHLQGINPHKCFADYLSFSSTDIVEKSETITAKRDTKYHNAVLAELAVEGVWPCQVAEAPYLLLLSRYILTELSGHTNNCWMNEESNLFPTPTNFSTMSSNLLATSLWSARTVIAHERLLLSREPTTILWEEAQCVFAKSMDLFYNESHLLRAATLLEYGLACYHFDKPQQGKDLFLKAMGMSGLSVEVTGAEGKRTKFQTKATAQMVVRATSSIQFVAANRKEDAESDDQVGSQMVALPDENVLLERVNFEAKEDNEVSNLVVLDQAILLALCLDVKNNNPADGLTAEEMSAYLARVLHHQDDWMVYSTALLERAWLEFEGVHTKERAILQMQALADQHTNRLTITQSTRKSVEESAPVEDRIKNLHIIVYPPRWHMLRDVAERYASLGIVTSAAEIFTEIEYWDEVVDCYRRAGKEKRAEEIIRERLEISETPRMWATLGELTGDPAYFKKSIDLSKGRFVSGYVSLGKHYFEKGDLHSAAINYRQALKLRPLLSAVWFRVGTISMQLEDWETALAAFSEVVQQQPLEAEAWANVAAVHMHNKHPTKAYPALVESLKLDRNNWRVWISKLYTCLDLKKYDEATQACSILLDFKSRNSAKRVPNLEEKCVRAIVGGVVDKYQEATHQSDRVALASARRSLARVHELLERIRLSSNEAWVFETTAYFHEQIGQDLQVFENLMKEYRSLSSVRAWEKDDHQVRKVCQVVSQIVHYQRDSKEKLVKSKFLLSGVLKRVEQARVDIGKIPVDIDNLRRLLDEVVKELQEHS